MLLLKIDDSDEDKSVTYIRIVYRAGDIVGFSSSGCLGLWCVFPVWSDHVLYLYIFPFPRPVNGIRILLHGNQKLRWGYNIPAICLALLKFLRIR
ncbi:MAG: hypothetical protein EAS52_15715 [Parapedobacter sp.]|nr:MAG: hypothetical protein EAS52_15715 [Parapedobacter sp.]